MTLASIQYAHRYDTTITYVLGFIVGATSLLFLLLRVSGLLDGVSFHFPNEGVEAIVASLDVYIASGRNDDFYQNVNVSFDGQQLPLAIDTSAADTFVASNRCNIVNPSSGCYRLGSTFTITNETTILPNEGFDMYLGKVRVIGNLSLVSVKLGAVESSNVTAALIEYAMPDEFQSGSFSGVLGLGLRTASQQWQRYRRLPFIDTLISERKLMKPLFSLSSPRYGDPEQLMGKLTLGGIENAHATKDIKYRKVTQFSQSLKYLDRLRTVGWSTALQGIRINGVELEVTPGRLRRDQQHVSVLDAGSSWIYLRTLDFYAVAEHFNGLTEVEPDLTGDKLYFECAEPQLLELKFHDHWFPVDPLDMLAANSRRIVNEIEMCQASIRTWDMTTFGDSLIGLPFLRSVFTVFDYVSEDLFSVLPRLGLASMVDVQVTKRRYQDMYLNRLQ